MASGNQKMGQWIQYTRDLRCRGTSWAFLIKKINAAKIQFRDYLSVVMRRCSISNETSLLCAYLRPQYSTRESRTEGPKRMLRDRETIRRSDGQIYEQILVRCRTDRQTQDRCFTLLTMDVVSVLLLLLLFFLTYGRYVPEGV